MKPPFMFFISSDSTKSILSDKLKMLNCFYFEGFTRNIAAASQIGDRYNRNTLCYSHKVLL